MSKTPDTDPVVNITSIPEPEPTLEESEKRPNILVRGYHKIKTNPKAALAVAGGAVLVGGAAFLGRATAPSNDSEPTLELTYEPVDPEVLTEDTDTVA